MKKEFLNTCYIYFNRFINSEELIEKLEKIDTKDFSVEDKETFDKLVEELKNIVKEIPNEEDELVKSKKNNIKKLKDKLDFVPGEIGDKELEEFLAARVKSLGESYNKIMDSYDRWVAITSLIDENDLFNKWFDDMSDYEKLEFIAQNIKVPFPPHFNQEEFDRLVKVGIEHDKREWLWRLALNYEGKDIRFDSIVDYFIKIKDGYYLGELICVVDLDLDAIIDKINDKELIEDLNSRKEYLKTIFTEEQFERLLNKKG